MDRRPAHAHTFVGAQWPDPETNEPRHGAHCRACGLTVPVGAFFRLPGCIPPPEPAPAPQGAPKPALRAVQ